MTQNKEQVMDEQECLSSNLAQNCKAWFNLSKKSKKDGKWMRVLRRMFEWLYNEIDVSQLLLTEQYLNESVVCLLNSAAWIQQFSHEQIDLELPLQENMILLEGQLQVLLNQDEHLYTFQPFMQITIHPNPNNKHNIIHIFPKSPAYLLTADRRLLEKYKFDFFKDDRQIKETFLSNFLFCNTWPVYALKSLQIMRWKQKKSVQISQEFVYLLYEGVVQCRSPCNKNVGYQLTKGSILNKTCVLKLIAEESFLDEEEQCEVITDSIIIAFSMEQLTRIIKVNSQLKLELHKKIMLLTDRRNYLVNKSTEVLSNNFFQPGNQFIPQIQQEKIHYPINLKPKTSTSTPFLKTFRQNHHPQKDFSYQNLITFNRYDQIISSKEKVVNTKLIFKSFQEDFAKPSIPPLVKNLQNKKKINAIIKNIKHRTYKIQKISQRQSMCNQPSVRGNTIREIKKKLQDVKSIFEEQIGTEHYISEKENQIFKNGKIHTSVNFYQKDIQHPISCRVSQLKPGDYLKNEYFQEFLKNSKTMQTLKECDNVSLRKDIKNVGHLSKKVSSRDSYASQK